MRKNVQNLVQMRSMDAHSRRRQLPTRGQLPRDLELLSTRCSMRSSVDHHSYPFITKMAPALRSLRKEVGRPWNDVYSELCERFRQTKGLSSLGLQNLLNQVDRNTFLAKDGSVWVQGAYHTYEVDGLYVHPVSGLLMEVPVNVNAAKQRKQAALQRKADKLALCVKVSDTMQLHKLEGLWYWVELAPIVAPAVQVWPIRTLSDGYIIHGWSAILPHTVCRDAVTGKSFRMVPTMTYDNREGAHLYGSHLVYAKRKWQASREDNLRYVPQERLAA